MSGPFVFISRSRVKPAQADGYHDGIAAITEMIEAEEPRMIGFNFYTSDDGTEVSTVQVHPDSESMDTHLKIFLERLAERAFDALETYEIDIYGTPSDYVLDTVSTMPGATVRVLPVHEGGFLRPQPL